MKLRELTNLNITPIFITHLPFESFISKSISVDPCAITIVPFRPYEKPDVLRIIAKDCPPEEELDFFLKFVEMIYDVFQRPCRDLNELRHLVGLLFPKYVEPVVSGKVTRQQTGKLFANIQFHIKEALLSIYMRDISSSEWQKSAENKESAVQSTLYDVELPFYTKFLLIAAFLASYNPPRLDLRYFSRGGGDEKRKRKGGRGKVGKAEGGGKMRQQLLGPKAFPLERMLAIFYSIVEDDVEGNIDMHTQVSSLISLRLLQRVTPMDRLDGVKCKCNVSFDFIQKVGRTVKFDIAKYLFDFI
ncbi:Origin recognition complex subunit 5 [Rhizophlyctis rosea]|nr:Origin recognition complex subunit 5 [Rhizophlyctis rosea]